MTMIPVTFTTEAHWPEALVIAQTYDDGPGLLMEWVSDSCADAPGVTGPFTFRVRTDICPGDGPTEVIASLAMMMKKAIENAARPRIDSSVVKMLCDLSCSR